MAHNSIFQIENKLIKAGFLLSETSLNFTLDVSIQTCFGCFQVTPLAQSEFAIY